MTMTRCNGVNQMFYKLVWKFSEELINWGDVNAPVDRKTIDNCYRFLFTNPGDRHTRFRIRW